MATYGRTIRRGLPRRAGGEPWPPADAVPMKLQEDAVSGAGATPMASNAGGEDARTGTPKPGTTTAPAATTAVPAEATATATATAAPAEDQMAGPSAETGQPIGRTVRRGLPRVAGGEPWPPAGAVPAPVQWVRADPSARQRPTTAQPVQPVEQVPAPAAAESASDTTPPSSPPAAAPTGPLGQGYAKLLRRGLPRVPGGEPWPPATSVVTEPVPAATEGVSAAEEGSATQPVAPEPVVPQPVTSEPGTRAPATEPIAEAPPSDAVAAATVEPSSARPSPAAQRPPNREEKKPRKPRSRTVTLLLGAAGLLVAALAAVFITRWLVTLGFMQEFLATYPGETDLPAGTEPGFPAWAQWQHFFNFFLIVLIIRSGLQVRRETRPPGYWTPKWSKGSDGKISINLWFHQTLDALWLVNGLVFVVLLFATGHWARLVPTTWEVIPNALSALIQYVSLDWPTENGWVNYNSLQMLAYFVTVFIAAPLAAISGARMSGIWPKNATTMNRVYPVEWARAIHFPVMLYFVVFIIGHVALVFATGALRNLNHMYGGQDAVNWTGFWIFFVSLLLVVGAWLAARPIVLAPVAGLFGRVSSR